MRFEVLIGGMVAVHARHAVFTALAGVEGIVRADVELGRATLECAREGQSAHEVAAEVHAVLSEAGFTVLELRELPRQLPTL